jgi:hypothetical protein
MVTSMSNPLHSVLLELVKAGLKQNSIGRYVEYRGKKFYYVKLSSGRDYFYRKMKRTEPYFN